MKNIIYDHQHSATSPTRIQIPASAHPRPLSLTPGFSQVHPPPLAPQRFQPFPFHFVSIRPLSAFSPNPKSKIQNRKSLKNALFQSISNLFKL
jgi:hypothetical protein